MIPILYYGSTTFNSCNSLLPMTSKTSPGKIGTAQNGLTHFDESGQAHMGDVLGIARVAAIMASKRTSDLIPLCHPLALTRVTVDFDIHAEHSAVTCTAQVETFGKTGVEMEALTAVQIGLLTIYDMCKAVDRRMVISDVRLMEKQGGKSGSWIR